MQKEPILFLNPILKEMAWGRERWTVSAHPNGDCIVREGVYKNRKLSELWETNRTLFGNEKRNSFPLLVKIIDAKEDLSIQVHPDDAYAKENENGSLGKTECWYILDCQKDAKLILNHNAESKEELKEMIENKEWNKLIREVPVQKGDFLQIDSGTIHAVKGGMLILETQQNSDITYRLYDYERKINGKERELHIEKSLDVIKVSEKPQENRIKKTAELQENKMNDLISCDYYKVWKLDVNKPIQLYQEYPFLICSVIEGSGSIDKHSIQKGENFILPANYGAFEMKGKMQLVMSTA